VSTRRRRMRVLGGGGGVAAPVIDTDAVIGTELDAGAGYSTYQWQSSSDGSAWADVSGATNQTYTPVDADFGLYLRVLGDGAASNAAGRVVEVPVQTLGAELLTNGDFSAWTGDDPDGWTVTGESGSDPMVTQVNSGGGAGTGSARLFSGGALIRISQSVLSAGSFYEFTHVLSALTGSVNTRLGTGNTFSYSTIGTKRGVGRASDSLFIIDHFAGDSVSDAASCKLITLNAQLTAPSANMDMSFFYTLPVSPVQGDTVWLLPRVSNFASGNYWLALLEYTGSQWNITLYSVASHTRTPRIATVTDIGATDGLRVEMDGDSISLYTTANDGANWTQRGTTISNSTYNTATGVNVVYASSVTPGRLVYTAA
jgi:hypothetical protein